MKELHDLLMQEIMTNPRLQQRLEAACPGSTSRNINNHLHEAAYGDVRAVVVIDEVGADLYNVLKRIRGTISVLELRTFVSDAGDKLHLFDTLYDEATEPVGPVEETPGDPLSPERRAARRRRRAESDTIIVPAREEGFKKVFLGEAKWWSIRVGAAMKNRIKYIAAYQVAPVSAVTHLTEVRDIVPYHDTGKYEVILNGPAKEITHVPLKDPKSSPQGPAYVRSEDLMKGDVLGGSPLGPQRIAEVRGHASLCRGH